MSFAFALLGGLTRENGHHSHPSSSASIPFLCTAEEHPSAWLGHAEFMQSPTGFIFWLINTHVQVSNHTKGRGNCWSPPRLSELSERPTFCPQFVGHHLSTAHAAGLALASPAHTHWHTSPRCQLTCSNGDSFSLPALTLGLMQPRLALMSLLVKMAMTPDSPAPDFSECWVTGVHHS